MTRNADAVEPKGGETMINRIREFRERRGLRLVDVGAKFVPAKDPTRIHMWETGKEFPRGENLLNLARILGCAAEDLFSPAV